MLEKLRIIFTIPELRQKIFLTLFLLCVYRVGWQIPLPMIDHSQLGSLAGDSGTLGRFLERVSVFSASQLTQITIFGLGIMPYISAAIILQLLGSVYKPLEDLRKEGEAGRKKINEYTRYLTVVLCLLQSAAFLTFVVMQPDEGGHNMIAAEFKNADGHMGMGWWLTAVLIMTCGSVFLMWLGEQIDEFGIGNGISLLIMAGIVAQMPGALNSLISNASFELSGLFNGNRRNRNVYCPGSAVCGSGAGNCVYHAGPATDSHSKRQTCPWPSCVWRNSAVHATANQSGRCDADHFCQFPVNVSRRCC